MLNEIELSNRFAHMWEKSRTDAGKSQEWIAKMLHVSRTTVQNWEKGFSCPSQSVAFRWFEALGLNPMPYYMELLYPELEDIKRTGDEDGIEELLIKIIHNLPKKKKGKLLFLFTGGHGSSPLSILELMNAHLQLPLIARLGVGAQVASLYEVYEETGQLVAQDEIKPDMVTLNHAVKSATRSLKDGEQAYSNLEGGTL